MRPLIKMMHSHFSVLSWRDLHLWRWDSTPPTSDIGSHLPGGL